MLKKIFTILIILFGSIAFASDNFLNSLVIKRDDLGTSIVLRSDEVAKVKKDVETSDKIILKLKDVKQSADITTLYKNVSDVNGLIVQTDGNDLDIYIEAKDISKANVVFETPDAAPAVVSHNDNGRISWSIISLVLFMVIAFSAKNVSNVNNEFVDNNVKNREREKELYKKFQKEVATLPSINYKLKGFRKHVLKGETVRSYESRSSVKI